jgi:hypothetical protein
MPAKGAPTSRALGEVLADGHQHSKAALNLSNRLPFSLRSILDCGGKQSATPLWCVTSRLITSHPAKAPSPLRFAGALQNAPTRSIPPE